MRTRPLLASVSTLLLLGACAGDVTTSTSDELDDDATTGPLCASEPLRDPRAGGAGTVGELWPAGEIPYVIQTDSFYPGSPTPATVQQAINVWNAKLGGRVRFVPRTTDVGAFLSIQAGPASAGNVTQYIGYAGFVKHDLTLANRRGTSISSPVDASLGVVLHELGHAIGMHHEHQRPDRDRYLTMATSAASGLTQACYPSTFGQVMTFRGQTIGLYDLKSIMHYGSPWPRPATCDSGSASSAANVNLFVQRDSGQPFPAPFFTMSEPSERDVAGVLDLYAMEWGWRPFAPHAVDRGATTPLDRKLAAGVSVFGSPAVATQRDGSLNLFALGTDSHVWMRWSEPAAARFPASLPVDWSGWYDLGACPSGAFVSEPAAASTGPGQVMVVVQGTTGLWSRTYAGGWGAWQFVGQPGGTSISPPALVALGGAELKVFVRVGATSGAVYTRSYSTGAWRGSWVSLGGSVKGKPAAASWGAGHFSVIAQPATGSGLVEYRSTGGVVDAWTTWGGALSSGALAGGSSPAVSAFGTGVLNVFVRGTDNHLWQRYLYGGAWSGWFDLGGALTGDPAAATWPGTGQVHVFATIGAGSERGLWQKTYGAP